jgi:hypothetical protein
MSWSDIPDKAYPMIGAVVGAVIALSGVLTTSFLGPRALRKIEESKLRAARQDALQKEVGLRIQQLAADLASAGSIR